MKLYVWYSRATSVTGRALALKLGLSRLSPNDRNRGYGTATPPIGTTHVINWGAVNSRWHRSNYRWKRNITWFNHIGNTTVFSNKFSALRAMSESSVSVPIHWNYKHTAYNYNFPLIGRKYRHWGGSGFKFITNAEELENDYQSDYWLEYIDGEDKREYRVHVFDGEVFRVQRKIPRTDEEIDYLCRSHSKGWKLSLRDIDRVHGDVKEQAIRAVASLGYLFGAVDIIRVPSTDVTKVLEVNSGAGLDNAGLQAYYEKFMEVLSDGN